MEWRSNKSESGATNQPKTFKPKFSNTKFESRFNNEKVNEEKPNFRNNKFDDKFKNDEKNEQWNTQTNFKNKRVNDNFSSNKGDRFKNDEKNEQWNTQTNFKNKRVNDNFSSNKGERFQSKDRFNRNKDRRQRSPNLNFKTHEEVDKYLNSGKYIPANKKSQLESLRAKLKAEYDKNHPDISNETMFPSLSQTFVQVEQPKTCWGKKLPSEIYDTSVKFIKHKKISPPKQSQKVNSDLSEDHDYDSFDDDDDYYNDYDDDEYYNEGY